MSWKHIVGIGISAVLLGLAVLLVILCGKSPLCGAPGVFAQVVTLAMAVVGTAGTIAGGILGNASVLAKVKPTEERTDAAQR